ncbi:MAG: HIRAN domain-containing protein [Hominimerdicola sp.]
MTRNAKSRVMTIANKLVGKGYSRCLAMVKAWIIAKAERLSVRVAGTSFNHRQSVLKAIDGKPAQIKLKHETDNLVDKNAVSVWVFAEGTRGYYRIGYLPKAVAYVVAPLLDKGESLTLNGVSITGGCRAGFNLGARLQLAV